MYADCTGENLKKVNEARYKISKKYMRRKRYSKFVPSSIMLGNIKTSLQAFISVDRLWTLSVQSHNKALSPVGHGWEDDMSVEWIKEPLPRKWSYWLKMLNGTAILSLIWTQTKAASVR